MDLMFYHCTNLVTGSNPLINDFHFRFSSKRMLSFLCNFKEKQFKNIQKIILNNHRRNIISCCRHPLSFSYSFSILITCQMLIWLTTPCIQLYCNFNQVIKRAVISLVRPFTDHCDTLVIDKWVPVACSKKCTLRFQVQQHFCCLSTCKNAIVLNSLDHLI